MEFMRLADVEVVETATETDKVLIEQNGEIKRVPKTEVGGSGNMFIADFTMDVNTGALAGTTNMTLDETISAVTNKELTGAIAYMNVQGMNYFIPAAVIDYTLEAGAPTVALLLSVAGEALPVMWTADGFAVGG